MDARATRRAVLDGVGALVGSAALGQASGRDAPESEQVEQDGQGSDRDEQRTEQDEQGADGWVELLDTDALVDRLEDVAALADGSAVVVGRTESEFGGSAPLAARHDESGQLLWAQEVQSERADATRFQAATRAHGDGAVCVGPASVRSGDGSRSGGWVCELTPDGEVAWETVLSRPEPAELADVARFDGGYVVAGHVGPDEDRSGFAAKLSRDGTTEWETVVDDEFGDDAFHAVAANEAGACLAGDTVEWEGEEELGRQAFAVGLDADGRERWRRTDGDRDADTVSDAATDGDGGFVLAGFSGRTPGGSTPSSDGLVIRVDGDGDRRWSREFGGEGVELLDAVEPTPEGVVAAGMDSTVGEQKTLSDDSWERPETTYLAWLLGVDPGGREGFSTTVEADGRDTEARGLAVHDGHALVAGYADDPGGMSGEDTEFGLVARVPIPEYETDGIGPDQLSGFGPGAALGALGVGSALVALRRRLGSE